MSPFPMRADILNESLTVEVYSFIRKLVLPGEMYRMRSSYFRVLMSFRLFYSLCSHLFFVKLIMAGLRLNYFVAFLAVWGDLRDGGVKYAF